MCPMRFAGVWDQWDLESRKVDSSQYLFAISGLWRAALWPDRNSSRVRLWPGAQKFVPVMAADDLVQRFPKTRCGL